MGRETEEGKRRRRREKEEEGETGDDQSDRDMAQNFYPKSFLFFN